MLCAVQRVVVVQRVDIPLPIIALYYDLLLVDADDLSSRTARDRGSRSHQVFVCCTLCCGRLNKWGFAFFEADRLFLVLGSHHRTVAVVVLDEWNQVCTDRKQQLC